MEVIQFGSQMMARDMGIGQQYNVLYYCNSKEYECESAFYFVFSYRHHPSKEYKSLIQQSHPHSFFNLNLFSKKRPNVMFYTNTAYDHL